MWSSSEVNFGLQFFCDKDALLGLKKGEYLKSHKHMAARRLWWIEIKRSLSNARYLAVFLVSAQSPVRVAVRYALRLTSASGEGHHEKIGQYDFFNCDKEFGRGSDFVSISALRHEIDKFSFGGKCLIEASIIVEEVDGIPICLSRSISFSELDNNDEIFESVSRSYSIDGPVKDFLVSSNDGKTFACHAYILARNPVFRNVYLKREDEQHTSSPCAKKSKDGVGHVVLRDMSGDVLRVVLSHIYHQSVKFDVSIAREVLHAAETHDQPLLKRECETVIVKNVNVENFLDCLLVGELMNSETVSKACMEFWPRHGREVMKLQEWNNFISNAAQDVKNQHLISRLMSCLFNEVEMYE